MIFGPEPDTGRLRPSEIVCLGLLLLLQGFLMRTYFVPTTGGTDANAYHVSSRMIQLHGRYHQVPEDELVFMGKMWVVNERGEFYPKYPPLYPALAGVSMRAFGDSAGLLINPICAVLVVLGAFVVCRSMLPGWAALFGAFTAGLNPVLNSLAVDQVSHSASVAFLTWSFAAFFWAVRSVGGRRTGLLFAAGLLIGYAVGVRYTNVLLTLPVLVWFFFRWREIGARQVLAWGAGFAIPCLYIAWYHWSSFGSPITTGYSLTQEQNAFTLRQFLENLRLYVPGATTHGLGPVFLLSCLGFVAVWCRSLKAGLFFSAWILPAGLLAVSYYFAPDNHPVSYMRFLLPLGLPGILLAVAFATDFVSSFHASPWARRALIAMLFLCQGGWGIVATIDHMERRFAFNDLQDRKVEFIRQNVPEGSVIFGPLWNLEALDYDQAYTLYDSQLVDHDLMRAILDRSLADPHMQDRRWAPIHARLFGGGEQGYAAVIRSLIAEPLAAGVEVFLVGNDEASRLFERTLPGRFELVPVAELPQLSPRSRLAPSPGLNDSSPLCLPLTISRVLQRQL